MGKIIQQFRVQYQYTDNTQLYPILGLTGHGTKILSHYLKVINVWSAEAWNVDFP